jgi:flagellar protein FliL
MSVRIRALIAFLAAMLAVGLPAQALAQDESAPEPYVEAEEIGLPAGMDPDDPAAGMTDLIYYTLGPSFVTNYDGAGRLKYLKTDISVRIRPGTAPFLDQHLPYIRNRLVVLLSGQLEENLTSTDGKETLRRQALEQVRSALATVESQAIADRVVNLYFMSFVVQR